MSHSSMSVHSLIDRFSKGDSPDMSEKEDQNRTHKSVNKQEIKQKQIEESGLMGLLGSDIKTFPLSEEAYIEVVKLRAEQERTKQDFHKVQIANKNLEIIQAAVKAHVPASMIPLMCVGNTASESPELPSKNVFQDMAGKGVEGGAMPQEPSPPQSSFKKTHSRSSSKRDSSSIDSFNASNVPPLNYKFGGGPSNFTKRPLSPAKIGAAAVANLAVPTPPYRGTAPSFRNVLPQHQRHYSMPVESSSSQSLTRYPSIDLSKIENSMQSPSRQRSMTSSTPSSRSQGTPNGGQGSIGGSSTTLQVKASPAQPLHKQKRSNQPPTQDSMTSFQHIIQFYHWKPEAPGVAPGGSGINNFRQHSHKRHKSNTENMSVDLGSNVPEEQSVKSQDSVSFIQSEDNTDRNDNDNDNDNENDMSMDSNITEVNTSKIIPVAGSSSAEGNSSQAQNVGRYPHDILSPTD